MVAEQMMARSAVHLARIPQYLYVAHLAGQ